MNLTKKQANILFVLLIVIVFTFIIFVTYFMISNKNAFTENPFIYGVKKMDLSQCYCNCFKENSQLSISFYINKTSFSDVRK